MFQKHPCRLPWHQTDEVAMRCDAMRARWRRTRKFRAETARSGSSTDLLPFQALERVLTEAAGGVSVPELTERELWGPLQFESDTFWQAEGFEWPPGSGIPGPETDPIVCEFRP